MSRQIDTIIDAADITERLVGITPIYLQNSISRGLYGLQASVTSGQVREQRRRFSRDDVFGIALVWLLFEAGLRNELIARALKEIAGTKRANANLAAKKLLDTKCEYLLIFRTPRGPSKSIPDKPDQLVQTTGQAEVGLEIEKHSGSDVVAIPIGHKFRDVTKRLEILF